MYYVLDLSKLCLTVTNEAFFEFISICLLAVDQCFLCFSIRRLSQFTQWAEIYHNWQRSRHTWWQLCQAGLWSILVCSVLWCEPKWNLHLGTFTPCSWCTVEHVQRAWLFPKNHDNEDQAYCCTKMKLGQESSCSALFNGVSQPEELVMFPLLVFCI